MSGHERQSGTWGSWLSHAFAVEKPDEIDPTPLQREIVDCLSQEIVRRQLTAPILLALEMSRPLNMLSAATMHMLQPIISVIMSTQSYEQFARFLEHRGSIDYICRRIEHFDREQHPDHSGGEHATHASSVGSNEADELSAPRQTPPVPR